MSEQGVPIEEATAKDFMQVRAALVRRLGGANEALVWTRIDWRADSAKVAHQTQDGTHWWAATHGEIADETGLSAEQVRRAIEKLVVRGFLREDAHHGFDRRKSYAPIYAHLADSPNGEIARSKRRNRQMELADSPDGSSSIERQERDIEDSASKADLALFEAPSIVVSGPSFDDFWAVWPKKVAKPDAQRAWAKAVKQTLATQIVDAAIAYRDNPGRPERQFIPYPATWLNREGWNDELPSGASAPMDRARDVLDLGRQMAAERAAS